MHISARIQCAIEVLDIFFQSRAPFDIVMAKFFKNNKWIGANDRRETAELSYSIFRNYETIKYYTSNITEKFGRFYMLTFLKIINSFSEDKITDIFSGKIHSPSRLTDFEKRFLSSLGQSKELSANTKLNYPQWMDPYFKNAFSDSDFENEMIALNEKAHVDLRINKLKSNKEDVKQLLSKTGFLYEDSKFSINGIRILNGRISRNHEIIAKGLAEIQDEGSQLVAQICDACSTDTVVDFCAGAGGKTLALAASMSNKGRIFALDKYHERLENAKLRFRRAGVNNVFCQEITNKWIKRHQECADIVLVDAPCSGTGTWRRNPDMRAKFFQKDLDELLIIQADILESAKPLVKKTGKLIYATCSVLKEENENQIEKFSEKFPEFEIKKIELHNLQTQSGFLRLSPFKHGTDGFFAAILERKI